VVPEPTKCWSKTRYLQDLVRFTNQTSLVQILMVPGPNRINPVQIMRFGAQNGTAVPVLTYWVNLGKSP